MRAVADCRIFSVERSVAASPVDGAQHTFYRILTPDWVQILPITAAGEAVMVRQYRHGAQRVTLEIPAGLVEPGEDPAVAGLRECLEETGYRALAAVPLGVLQSESGVVRQSLARVLRGGCGTHRGDREHSDGAHRGGARPVARAPSACCAAARSTMR